MGAARGEFSAHAARAAAARSGAGELSPPPDTPARLRVPVALAEALRAHARRAAPDECVGLLFGHKAEGRVMRAAPLPNHAQTPRTTFFAAPQELFDALRDAAARAEDLLAIYHSHPHGPPHPSPTDVAAAHYHALCVIVTPGGMWAFELGPRGAAEVRLELSDR